MRALTRPNPEHVYDPAIEISNLIDYRERIYEDPARSRKTPIVGQSG